jgi:hypothetical protein
MSYLLLRRPDRGTACWAVIGVAALAAAVACTRPMFEIGIGAYIGGGDEQRGFDYDRVLTPLTDLRPWSLVMLAAALILLVTTVVALIWGNRPILVLVACAVALLSLGAALNIDDRLGWVELGGVVGYEEPHGGRLLQPAIDELKADARRSPEAQEPGWELVGGKYGYRSRGLDAWWLVLRLTIVVSILAAFRGCRLFVRFWPAVAFTVVGTFGALVVLIFQALSRTE